MSSTQEKLEVVLNNVKSKKDEKEKKQVVVSKETTKRLIKDIREVVRHPLNDNGIYYIHDELDMLKGYAMIIGPADTIYQHGFYFFEFTFPTNYPYSPPRVIYHTNDGLTRFHPNLYRNGKVCLSILNTWSGEQWTSCQTLRTVLLTMVTLFHNKSLLNEPGINEKHRDFQAYHEVVHFRNWQVACLGMIHKTYFKSLFDPFYSIMISYFKEKNETIKKDLKKMVDEKDNLKSSCTIYNDMNSVVLKYREVMKLFEEATELL